MSFEEDFPLLDKELDTVRRDKLNFPINILKRCCLDKQKVREIIRDMDTPIHNGEVHKAFRALKRRLGLEEKE